MAGGDAPAAPSLLRVASIPGDGIGPEVTRVALRAAGLAAARHGLRVAVEELPYSAETWIGQGLRLRDEDVDRIRGRGDAVFLGALGDPRIPDMAHGRDILLGLRQRLDLFVNLRPAHLLHERLCPLKGRGPDDVAFVLIRENTEGAYSGRGKTLRRGTAREVGIERDVNTHAGVERILRYALEWARARGLRRVCMSDKSNVLVHGHGLWRRLFAELTREYPELETRHLYVDALAMEMVRDPSQFEVIVTCNLFGDILSDLAAQLQGGMGMAPSANLNPETGAGLFEPVHGSAPDIAGRGIANPLAAVLSAAMMLEHAGCPGGARDLRAAVVSVVHDGYLTADLGGRHGTEDVGDRVCEHVIDGVPSGT